MGKHAHGVAIGSPTIDGYTTYTPVTEMPGMPALLLLAFSILAGACFGALASPPWRGIAPGMGCFAVFSGMVAAPFWLWAVLKVVSRGDPDLGAVSFALVLYSSCFTVLTACRISGTAPLPAKAALGRRMLVWSRRSAVAAAVVSANYAFIIFKPNLPGTFRMYLAVGAVFWLAVACAWLYLRDQRALVESLYFSVRGADEADDEDEGATDARSRMLGRI